jgi:tRNA A-37 threonylcarbamoyl transferase component Bud32
MKKVEIPAYFSTLNKGNATLYVKKEYENRMSVQDIDKLFDLCKDSPQKSFQVVRNELNAPYQGRTSCKTLLMESLGNESFVVREYWHGGLLGKVLKDLFWDVSRPLRELSICEVARRGHINTTEIIAIIKNKIVGPLYKFQLVTREIKNSLDLIELLSRPEDNQLDIKKREIINKLAKVVKEMHDAEIYHADLHLKNILVQFNEGESISIYIIDLDKSKQYEKISFQRRMKNIIRLDRSLEKFKRNIKENSKLFVGVKPDLPVVGTDRLDILAGQVSSKDKIRFLREYLKLYYLTGAHSFGSQKELLKFCIDNYKTAHRSHKIWWRVLESFSHLKQ